jgi:hypothetical protein
MTLASFFDVNNNGIDVTDLAAVLGFVALFAGTLVGLFRWSRKQLREEIREVVQCEINKATAPIQPGANGGLSLPDVAKSTHRLEIMIGKIASSIGVSYDDLD